MNVYGIAAEWEHYKAVVGKTDNIGRKEFIDGALMMQNHYKRKGVKIEKAIEQKAQF